MAHKKNISADMVNESVAMTKDFINELIGNKGFKDWTSQQQRLLSLFLNKIQYDEAHNNPVVQLTYRDIINGLGWDYKDNERNMKQVLEPDIDYMMGHCKMWLQGRNNSYPNYAENLIIGCKFDFNGLSIKFNHQFMDHLENLFVAQRTQGWQFFIMPISDLQIFKSKYSEFFFFDFLTHGAIGGRTNTRQMSTNDIKYLVGLKASAYMRKEQTFDRANFERRVIIPAMEEIDKTEMIEIVKTEDGKYFEKVKERNRVYGYKFKFKIYNIHQIYRKRQGEQVDVQTEEIVCEIPNNEI